MTQALLFDYGGTLDNGGDHWAVTIREGWQKAGIDVDLDVFIDAYVHAERTLAANPIIKPYHNFGELMRIKAHIELERLAANGYSIPPQAAETIAKHCDDRARHCTAQARPVLEQLAERYPLVLVSNFYGNIECVLADYGLRHLFPDIIESAVVCIRKPDPRIFAMACGAADVEPSQATVIGDSVSKDIIPAQSIGCSTIWIEGRPWFGDKPVRPQGNIISNITELAKLL